MPRFCSIFSQLLQLFPRHEFQKAVEKTQSERHARGFRSWDQFVAMLFCQLGRAQSLREICGGLASCQNRLVHLGTQTPKRSTLAYANQHRCWQLFAVVFDQMLDRCRQVAGPRKFRFKNKLLSLDSTLIELCSEVFHWAPYQRTKGAIKLHFTLDHDGYLPTVVVMTDGNHSDLPVARQWEFAPGTILVFDRGYIHSGWFEQLTRSGVFFVTRTRANMVFETLQQRPVPEGSRILADRVIRPAGKRTKHYPQPLRCILVQTDDGRVLELLTNHFKLAASTVAAIYKDRWQIELFFKALKQNLRIKSFVGTSPNALLVQIWTALIAMLMLKYLQFKARIGWSLSNLVALLRMNLFVYRDLWTWLDDPFAAPPPLLLPVQLELSL
jgi:hypothetical protein